MALKNASDIFLMMNEWFANGKPFFFLIDFKKQFGDIQLLENLSNESIFLQSPIYECKHNNTFTEKETFIFEKHPESFETYAKKFQYVKKEIQKGNSYLTNLTCTTPVYTNFGLGKIYTLAKAKYKLCYKDQFVHFSPETFIRIEDNKIATFPMKGTIDASIENAAKILLENEKEKTEQYIITDLLRNDLSMVAEKVKVEKFRYLEKIETNGKPLLQASSHISGSIKPAYQNTPGDIFSLLLPAGSICGAPKNKTLDIIEKVEGYNRGFYTGVWGIFDGKKLDSCVIIRLLEKAENGYMFKSGGGITASSNLTSEYQEMIDKIYVPIY